MKSKNVWLKTTIHIGIIDFTLFPDAPEFYSEYLLMNTKSQKIYNSKFVLCVLDLTQIDHVSEEEKQTDLYYWAKLFNAKSWEEITVLAEKNEIMKEAAATIKKLSSDEKIKLQCEARERYERDMLSAIHAGEKRGKILQLAGLVKDGLLEESVAQKRSGLSEEEFKKWLR